MSMAYRKKKDVIEFSKELFLTPDEQGNHKYSLRAIVAEVKQKLNKDTSNPTVLHWSRKYGWDKLWEEGVRKGLTNAIIESESNKSKEEQLKEAIANQAKDKTIMGLNLLKLSYKFIIENGVSSTKEAVAVMHTALELLEGLQQQINVSFPTIVLPENVLPILEEEVEEKKD